MNAISPGTGGRLPSSMCLQYQPQDSPDREAQSSSSLHGLFFPRFGGTSSDMGSVSAGSSLVKKSNRPAEVSAEACTISTELPASRNAAIHAAVFFVNFI